MSVPTQNQALFVLAIPKERTMKSSTRNGLTSAAAFFALCASVVACGPGGGGGGGYYRSNSYPKYQSYPSQSSTVSSTPVNRVTATSVKPTPASTVVAPAAPQARLTVISDAPTGNVQLASPVSTDSVTATVREASLQQVVATESKPDIKNVTPVEEKTDSAADVSKALDSTASVTPEATSKIADAIKGLVGTWMAVSRQGDGALSTVELQLDDHGWAKLTMPGADGKPSTTTRKVEFENNELKLTGEDADVMLGKLVDFDSRQMVLERSGGQVTFVRP